MTLKTPIFLPVFSTRWNALPSVLRKHYVNRPNSKDVVTMKGLTNVKSSNLMRVFSPFMDMMGISLPPEGSRITTIVYGRSEEDSNHYVMDRQFSHPNKKNYYFKSFLQPIGEDNVLEVFRYGICWHSQYVAENDTIQLRHKGYAWRIGKTILPLPLTYMVGECSAEETAIDDDSFKMKMTIKHFLLGDLYQYDGVFKVTDVNISSQ